MKTLLTLLWLASVAAFANRPSFNDDAVNHRLNISWAIEF